MKSAQVINYISRLWAALTNAKPKTKQAVSYSDTGRGGYVVYNDAQGEIPMYFEFGGGNCVAIIDVPTTAEWTKKTKRLPAERAAILQFTAKQVIRDKAPNCYYRVLDNCIEIFN